MIVSELINKLKEYKQDLQVIITKHNKYTETYAVVDSVSKFNPWIDLFGTPGKIDSNLPDNDCIHLGTYFPYEHSMGSDFVNTPIELVNGEKGDPYLIWKLNSFTNRDNCWFRIENKEDKILWEILYYADQKQLIICNYINDIKFTMISPGIEDLRDAIKLCKINLTIIS